MAEILLFHHILGLTPGVVAVADALRTAGHTVHAPDLFDGRTFETIDAGQRYCEDVGFDEILDRGTRAADGLPDALVFAGLSLGVMPAQRLLQTRPGARAGLFYHSFIDPAEFGTWPVGVPVQIHAMRADSFFVGDGDIGYARALVDARPEAELYLYRGSEHLFTDISLPSYDPKASRVVFERSLAMLDRL